MGPGPGRARAVPRWPVGSWGVGERLKAKPQVTCSLGGVASPAEMVEKGVSR